MLPKQKTLIKARIISAINNDDKDKFREAVEKIPSFFDEFSFLESINSELDVIPRKIESREDKEEYIKILKGELNDFYYNSFLIIYHYPHNFNESLKIIDNTIQTVKRDKVKNLLYKTRLELLLEYDGPEILQDKINEEIDRTLSKIDSF
jgi:hypothetical protein